MDKKRVLIVIFLICALFDSQSQNSVKAVNVPENYTTQLNIVYTKVNNWEGKLDLYYNSNSELPTPVVINIHGGGWNHGDKESQTGFGSFFKNGYAVANIEYRLVNVAPAPAAVEDVRCALIYLFANAKEFNIDTNKIVIMGGSSGGHLALMGGLLANDKRFDSNCEFDGEIKVAAIIDKYGVSDLVPLKEWSSAKKWLGDNYMNQRFTESVSPIYYVNKNSPPVFIIHGDSDPIVPYQQSYELNKKLVSFGVKTEFMTIPKGNHGKFPLENNIEISSKMWKFLNELGL